MSPEQEMVKEFHVKFGHTAPRVYDELEGFNPELRTKLILEEAQEFADAAAAQDPVEMIDALCDLIYVAYGAAVSMGIDLEAYFKEVHRSNMAKLGIDGKPIYNADGKVVKPPDWKPPDLARLFEVDRVVGKIHSTLKDFPPDDAIRVLRAASIMSTGHDLSLYGKGR